jgi:protein-disulfide isomerase
MSILDNNEERSIVGLSGSPKTMFLLGLSTGVGSMAVVALAVILTFLMKGETIGALAANPNQDAAKVAAANPTAAQPSANDPTAAAAQQPPAEPLKPVDPKVDHIRGNVNAKVTLVEYSDFECPYCLNHESTIKKLLDTYKNDIRVVYRNFPLSFHPEAQKAAEAAECAGLQGKYWEMHDKIFEANSAGKMSVQQWKDDAKALGLDTVKFNKCLDNGETAARISQEEQEGGASGVSGTPATFVNGKIIEGAVPYATFESMVKAAGAQS